MKTLSSAQLRGIRLAYLIVGVAVPLIGWSLWSRQKRKHRSQEIDEAHDITVEDSFPASDPPSSW